MTDARAITGTLGGRWHGHYGTAHCPVCQHQRHKGQNALTLTDGDDGRLLAHCKKSNCAFGEILSAVGAAAVYHHASDPEERGRREAEQRAEATKKARQAEGLWREARPIAGTIAENYLREARGITCPLPSTLRFHPDCWHGPTAKRHPALVALVEGGAGFAVHRTYLRADGSGKAPLEPAKMMLGSVAGGAVRLAEGPGGLAVAEGIETALSLACGLLRARGSIWAALSTSGLRGLNLPPEPRRLTIAPDGDDAGRAAAQDLAERAHARGWEVFILPAPNGRDWNDILAMKGDAA